MHVCTLKTVLTPLVGLISVISKVASLLPSGLNATFQAAAVI